MIVANYWRRISRFLFVFRCVFINREEFMVRRELVFLVEVEIEIEGVEF